MSRNVYGQLKSPLLLLFITVILLCRRIQRIDTAEDDDKSGVFVAEAGPIIEWTNGAGNEAVVEDIMLNTNVSLFIFIHCIDYFRQNL